jgi:phospholipase/lecithinase/hemolysin
MKLHTLSIRLLSASLVAAALAACGGGGGSTASSSPAAASITSVRVFGDSLADAGTFGVRFTVNNAGPGGSATPIFPDLVAKTLGAAAPCNYYSAPGFAGPFTNGTTCKNFAVGGAKINNEAASGGTALPYSISKQFSTSLSTLPTGAYPANELIIIDGGGNDTNALMTAYAGAASGLAGENAYVAFASTIVPANVVNAALAGASPLETLGVAYMQTLAANFSADIKTNLLGKGATKIALLNAPAISNTPLFKGSFPPAALAGVTVVERMWTKAYNTALAQQFAGEARVAIVDFFTEFDNQVTNPAQFNLTNVTTPVCTSITSAPGCFSAGLDASPLAATWRSAAFSDGFHPTPYGHVLAAQLINRALIIKCWI